MNRKHLSIGLGPTPFPISFCLVLALVLTVCTTQGCKTSGRARAKKSVSSADSLRKEFVALKSQIGVTVQSLDNVVAAANGDLPTAYESYIEQLDSIDTRTKAVLRRSNDLQKRTAAYIKGWEKQMKDVDDEELKTASMKRRKEMEQEMTNLDTEIQNVRSHYSAFIKNLRDIQTALDVDLNPAGVNAIAPIVKRTKLDAESVGADIDNVITSLNVIYKQIAPQVENKG